MLILTFFRKHKAMKLKECEEHVRCGNFSSFTWILYKKKKSYIVRDNKRKGRLEKQATHWVDKTLIKCYLYDY